MCVYIYLNISQGDFAWQSSSGVDGRAHFHPDVFRIFLQLERKLPQSHRQAYRRFQGCELVADAFASAATERNEGIIWRDFVRVETGE